MAKRSRTERREATRAAVKLAERREKLAVLEPGGAAARAIAVGTASVIEPHARSLPCARCGAEASLRVDAHEAIVIEGERFRLVRLQCSRCGAPRSVYFRIVLPS
jgi:ribosomal protein S27AE